MKDLLPPPDSTPDSTEDLLDRILRAARRAGAEAAEAVLIESVSLEILCRMGQCETRARAETRELGLRVFIGGRQAGVSRSGGSDRELDAFARRAVACARAAPADPWCGLTADMAAEMTAEAQKSASPDLDICDPEPISLDRLEEMARTAEEAALSQPGIENSDGAHAQASITRIARATSDGFAGVYISTRHAVSCTALAARDGQMERDYEYALARHACDLPAPDLLGSMAATRVLARLGARKVPSGIVPVFYEARAARRLLGAFAAAASGAAVARGGSFLGGQLNQPIFAPEVSILDAPGKPRGLRARPFDSEGLAARPLTLVKDGVLQSFLLDGPSARQLGTQSTGHASAPPGAPPTPVPSNLALAPGARSPDDMIGDIDAGFYVSELIGQGINIVTGDYSQGAAGFWIEKGRRSHAVSEITLAGNLPEMFKTLQPANDLEHLTGLDAPGILIPAMTLAGA